MARICTQYEASSWACWRLADVGENLGSPGSIERPPTVPRMGRRGLGTSCLKRCACLGAGIKGTRLAGRATVDAGIFWLGMPSTAGAQYPSYRRKISRLALPFTPCRRTARWSSEISSITSTTWFVPKAKHCVKVPSNQGLEPISTCRGLEMVRHVPSRRPSFLPDRNGGISPIRITIR